MNAEEKRGREKKVQQAKKECGPDLFIRQWRFLPSASLPSRSGASKARHGIRYIESDSLAAASDPLGTAYPSELWKKMPAIGLA